MANRRLIFWHADVVDMIVKDVRKKMGAAWDLVGDELRAAMVSRYVLSTVRRGNATYTSAQIDELYMACMIKAGLLTEQSR